MARYRKKKAFYEVIGKTGFKSGYGKTLEQLHPEKDAENAHGTEDTTSRVLSKWPKRPRLVQYNAGRVEISVPYQLGIAVLMSVLLLVLVFYRLGQLSQKASTAEAVPAGVSRKAVEPAGLSVTSETAAPTAETGVAGGNNRIVITQYHARADLEPVKNYFAEYGIAVHIIKGGDRYYLVTTDKYDNPQKAGTDGYVAKQRIIEVGASYKAPQGYETFGSKPFQDAYGKRFDD